MNTPSIYRSVQLRNLGKISPSKKVQIEIHLVVDPAGFWFNPRKNSNLIVVIFYDRAVKKLKVNIFS